MSIKQRREREKQATREGILTAARQIARQEGWHAVTIRKVAERIEYSPPMVYEYFASKEDILLELMHIGFRLLISAMQQASATTEDPEERLFHITDAYWSFARSNPELYQVMNGLGGVTLDVQATTQAGQESAQLPLEALQAWAHAFNVVLQDGFGATEIVWSLIHGMISLVMSERISGGEVRAQLLLRQALQSLLTAWRTTKQAP